MKRAAFLSLALAALWGCTPLSDEAPDVPLADAAEGAGDDDGGSYEVYCRAVRAQTTQAQCGLIEQQIDDLVQGIGALDAPTAMNRGDTRKVTLRISPEATSEELIEQPVSDTDMDTRSSEDPAYENQTETFDVEISRIMEAQLTGTGFNISPSEPVE